MGYKLVVHSEIIFSRGVRACPMPRVRHHKSSGRHWGKSMVEQKRLVWCGGVGGKIWLVRQRGGKERND